MRSVAFSDDLPLVRPETIEMRPPARPDASQPVDLYSASPGFFETLGIPILRGREHEESDGAALLLAAAAMTAMLGPARRGAKSDPMNALRCD